jgi:hypothetical protein
MNQVQATFEGKQLNFELDKTTIELLNTLDEMVDPKAETFTDAEMEIYCEILTYCETEISKLTNVDADDFHLVEYEASKGFRLGFDVIRF